MVVMVQQEVMVEVEEEEGLIVKTEFPVAVALVVLD